MKHEKYAQMVGWFFDQFSDKEDYLVRLVTPAKEPTEENGVAYLYDIRKGTHTNFASRVYPSRDLIQFGTWLYLIMGVDHTSIFDPRRSQSTKGRLDLCGQNAYFWSHSYPENDGWVCEIHISFKAQPSEGARNRIEASRIVREADITAEMSDEALMQVAQALTNRSSGGA